MTCQRHLTGDKFGVPIGDIVTAWTRMMTLHMQTHTGFLPRGTQEMSSLHPQGQRHSWMTISQTPREMEGWGEGTLSQEVSSGAITDPRRGHPSLTRCRQYKGLSGTFHLVIHVK